MLPTLFLPGLVCDDTVWEYQLRALAHSCSPAVASYGDLDSLPDMAAAVLATAPERFVIVGHSMGGRIALEVLRREPGRVMGAALLDTGYQARSQGAAGEQERAGRMALVNMARTEGMRAMGARWVQGMVHPERVDDRVLIDAILDMIERRTLHQYESQIHALLERPDATGVLRATTCPTLVMCGRQDAWSPLEQHEAMVRLVPDARLEVIEHCGHMSTMEQPEAVARILGGWLDAIRPC